MNVTFNPSNTMEHVSSCGDECYLVHCNKMMCVRGVGGWVDLYIKGGGGGERGKCLLIREVTNSKT